MHKNSSQQLQTSQKGGKRPDHPYRRSFYAPPGEINRAAASSVLKAEEKHLRSGHEKPTSQDLEPLKREITGWMRFMIYEVDLRQNATYKVGTIYGRDTGVLAGQVAALLKRKWRLNSASVVKVNRIKHQIDIKLSPIRDLVVGFELPGNSNIRSLGQIFGILARQVIAGIAIEPERGLKNLTTLNQ